MGNPSRLVIADVSLERGRFRDKRASKPRGRTHLASMFLRVNGLQRSDPVSHVFKWRASSSFGTSKYKNTIASILT